MYVRRSASVLGIAAMARYVVHNMSMYIDIEMYNITVIAEGMQYKCMVAEWHSYIRILIPGCGLTHTSSHHDRTSCPIVVSLTGTTLSCSQSCRSCPRVSQPRAS